MTTARLPGPPGSRSEPGAGSEGSPPSPTSLVAIRIQGFRSLANIDIPHLRLYEPSPLPRTCSCSTRPRQRRAVTPCAGSYTCLYCDFSGFMTRLQFHVVSASFFIARLPPYVGNADYRKSFCFRDACLTTRTSRSSPPSRPRSASTCDGACLRDMSLRLNYLLYTSTHYIPL